tara:strand:+ start:1012 stop:2118 length:1107 start_codon:yes stop_codon:yes gene_type:complete
MTWRGGLWAGFLILGLVVSCWESQQDYARFEPARRDLLKTWGEQVIVPWYEDFAEASEAFEQSAGGLCTPGASITLEEVQAAWVAVRRPWKHAEVIAFGPYKEEPYRLGPKLDFWPAREDAIEERLTDDEPLTQDLIDDLGASQIGLPVIEYLLFSPRPNLDAPFSADERRCAYLLGLSHKLKSDANRMLSAWTTDGYLESFVQAGLSTDVFYSSQAALSEVVNRIGFTLENMRHEKLSKAAGIAGQGPPLPETIESRFAQRSLADLGDNLAGLERIVWGDAAAGIGGLVNYLELCGRADLEEPLRQGFDGVREALEQIPQPLSQAVVDEPAPVLQAIDALKALQRVVQVDVAPGLWVTVGFNDSDGD